MYWINIFPSHEAHQISGPDHPLDRVDQRLHKPGQGRIGPHLVELHGHSVRLVSHQHRPGLHLGVLQSALSARLPTVDRSKVSLAVVKSGHVLVDRPGMLAFRTPRCVVKYERELRLRDASLSGPQRSRRPIADQGTFREEWCRWRCFRYSRWTILNRRIGGQYQCQDA